MVRKEGSWGYGGGELRIGGGWLKSGERCSSI